MRHVQKEKDQVRWQDAGVHSLPELQDRMHLHSSRKEAQSSKRVGAELRISCHSKLTCSSHKYIEGLENRLGRMESLLRLSGILSDEDAGATDLGTLEKRLADRASQAKEKAAAESTEGAAAAKDETATNGTPRPRAIATPRSGDTSPEPPKSGRNEEEVEVLSDMMCSLVTNNCGETRYIGMILHVCCTV